MNHKMHTYVIVCPFVCIFATISSHLSNVWHPFEGQTYYKPSEIAINGSEMLQMIKFYQQGPKLG